MRVEFSHNKQKQNYHFVCFMSELTEDDESVHPYLVQVRNHLKSLFSSVEFLNETSIQFRFKNDEDNAHFIVWAAGNHLDV